MKNKSVLIIGGYGFLGKNLYEYFLRLKNFDVFILGKHEPQRPFDIVINCGGKIHNSTYSQLVDSNTLDPVKYLLGYFKLNNNVKYLHLGSSSEYGVQTKKLSETSTMCNPTTEYGITKYLGSLNVIQSASILGCFANVIRPFSVFGKHDNSYKFIPKIIDSVKKDCSITLYPGSHDWIYIDDFCNLCNLIISSDYRGEIINAGTGICTPNEDVLNCLFELMNKKVEVEYKKELYRSYDTDYWAADISKAQQLFNWSPQYNLKDGLNDLINK